MSEVSLPTGALRESILTVPSLLQARARASPDASALWELCPSGWQAMTWLQVRNAVDSAASGLRALGLRRGDRVGIIAPSSPRWDIAQFATMASGGVVVGLDPHDTDERLAKIATQCELTGIIAQDEVALARIGLLSSGALRLAVTFAAPKSGDVVAYCDLIKSRAPESEPALDPVLPDEAALIVFTSGTTGEPKGIVYTHLQVCTAVGSILEAFDDIDQGSRLACWLPLSNLFQRMINLCAVGRGAQTFYVEDPRAIMRHVPGIAPQLLIGVPRFYEKLHAGICDALAAKPAWQQRLAQWAIRAGDRRAAALRKGDSLGALDTLRATIAERLVLRRIRAVLGNGLRFLISGSAPMPLELLERLHALGFLVLEAYGMSESIVPVALNRPRAFKFGTVGRALSPSEVRVAADGELQLRGRGVFLGYLGDRGSADRFDGDGFLATGDYARIDDDGFITLLGRKSEVFKTSTGRRIAPASIEGHLRRIPYVEHAVVFGANRPFPLAVIQASEESLRTRLPGQTPCPDPESVAALVRVDVAAAVAELPSYERPAGVILCTRPFSVADGQITPNLKVRRDVVEATFGANLDELCDAIARRATPPLALVREGGNVILLSA